MSDSCHPSTVARQAPLSVGFSRQEYWSGLPFPSPGDLPDPGIKPGSPPLQADDLPTELWRKLSISWSLPKFMSIESVMRSNHLSFGCLLLLLPSIFSTIRVFSNESVLCIRWPKYWSFSFSISPSNGCSGLISFRIDWLDLLAVQGTLKLRLLQHHSSKASILRHFKESFLKKAVPPRKPKITPWITPNRITSAEFSDGAQYPCGDCL